jgi:drug/metabolite transporter (DMT)-like permease
VRTDRLGVLLVLASAAAFGANAIFAKLAYADGATVGEFLTLRFATAALVFWLLLRPRVTRREWRPGLLLGVAYCGQAGFFFTAESLQSAAATSVFQAITPAVVAIGAIATGRERPHPLIFAGIAGAGIGIALVSLGGGAGGVRVVPIGIALSIASAVWYAGYLLAGDRVVSTMSPTVLGCLVATGGAVGFTVGSLALGQLRFHLEPLAALWIALSAVLSTVFAVTAVMAGMKRVGPSLTGLLSTAETVATIAYAFAVFGERLAAPQVVGALVVLVAITAVQLAERRPVPAPGP